MNRENKRKLYDKHYYRPTPATKPSPAGTADGSSFPKARAATTATIALTACAPFTLTTPPATAKPTAAR